LVNRVARPRRSGDRVMSALATAYGAAPMLNWLVEKKGIAPHIPVNDKSQRDDGTFSRSDFQYDPTSDVYHCPGGKRLRTSGTVHNDKTLLYRASRRVRYMPTQARRGRCFSSRLRARRRGVHPAAQRNHHARSRATSMSAPATLPTDARMSSFRGLCCRSPLSHAANNDSILLTRIAAGASHDGSAEGRTSAAFLSV
jgi:hypothetical protein